MTDQRYSQWRSLAVVAALVMSLVPKIAFGLGADHPNDRPVFGADSWPEGLKELVNRPERVHGFFVNWSDVFFFAGDSDKLDEFLKAYAKLPGTNQKIVLRSGEGQASSPWDKAPRGIAADWKLYATPLAGQEIKDGKVIGGNFTAQLDIWTGGHVDLPRLFIILPANIPVEAGDDAKDDAKIQKLIERHKQRQQADAKKRPQD